MEKNSFIKEIIAEFREKLKEVFANSCFPNLQEMVIASIPDLKAWITLSATGNLIIELSGYHPSTPETEIFDLEALHINGYFCNNSLSYVFIDGDLYTRLFGINKTSGQWEYISSNRSEIAHILDTSGFREVD